MLNSISLGKKLFYWAIIRLLDLGLGQPFNDHNGLLNSFKRVHNIFVMVGYGINIPIFCPRSRL
jgi:hypothetical protein